MKTLEKIVLKRIKSLVPSDLDPFQIAYKATRCCDDAISICCHEIRNHLEQNNSYARMLFIDYSSAFNTIVHAKLHSKLINDIKLPTILCNWLLDFLKSQVVRVGNTYSSSIVINIDAPQGCPLSPTLYCLFIHDCKPHSTESSFVKYADGTTVTGFIQDNDELAYRSKVNSFVNWCDRSNLELNVSKTKEMVIDFSGKKDKPDIEPNVTNGEVVERLYSFKFLGTYISNNRTLSVNCTEILKKDNAPILFV